MNEQQPAGIPLLDQLYAALGRKQLQLEAQDREYDNLLKLLAAVVDGSIEASRITVNLPERSWALADKKPEKPDGQG